MTFLCLLLVSERGVGLNGVNGGDKVSGGSDGVMAEGVRTVGAVPMGVREGERGRRETRKVPGSGTRSTGEGLGGTGFEFAEHADAIGVARKLRHFPLPTISGAFFLYREKYPNF